MANEVDVKVYGDREVKRMLRRMRRRARNLRKPFEDWGDALRIHNAAHFATEGIHGTGARWDPLKPRYAAWKFRMVGPRPILQFSGALFRSLTSDPMAIERVTRRAAEFGTDDPKAHWHQKGTRHMPARPPLVVTRGLKSELNRLVADHIVGDEV